MIRRHEKWIEKREEEEEEWLLLLPALDLKILEPACFASCSIPLHLSFPVAVSFPHWIMTMEEA